MQFFNSRPGALGVVLAIVAVGAVPVRAAEEPPENWQLKFQTTGIVQYKPGFDAPYSGTNSLVTNHEYSRSVTATLFGGVRLWKGGEFYVNPEMALGVPFSELKGLGGFNNGEMARTSGCSCARRGDSAAALKCSSPGRTSCAPASMQSARCSRWATFRRSIFSTTTNTATNRAARS